MYQRTGQKDYNNNIFTAIPYTKDNSHEFKQVGQGETHQFNIVGSECYTCWYFIRVDVEVPDNADYTLTINQPEDIASGQFLEIRRNTP
jgi:hypothetical protein